MHATNKENSFSRNLKTHLEKTFQSLSPTPPIPPSSGWFHTSNEVQHRGTIEQQGHLARMFRSASEQVLVIRALVQGRENAGLEEDAPDAVLQILVEVTVLQIAVRLQRADHVGEPGRFEFVAQLFQNETGQRSAAAYMDAGTVASIVAKEVDAQEHVQIRRQLEMASVSAVATV